MDILSYSVKSAKEILQEFAVNGQKGLSLDQAKKLLAEHGSNEIAGQVSRWWDILWRQFKSPFIYLLIAAAILAMLLRQTFESLMILLFLVINAVLGFYQEFRSEKILQLLKKYTAAYAKVIRQGKELAILTKEVVPGDIIILETGDKIPADVRLIDVYNLTVDESILTGESAPVDKISDPLPKPAKEFYQAKNIGFSGTVVVNGQAKGVVLATGPETATGHINRLTLQTMHVSDFEKGVARISKFILRLILVTLVFVFLANAVLKKDSLNLFELIIFSIALAVSVVPEALPAVTTFSLSRGALKLAKKKVVVRRLSAIEDLGGIEILCTDKTGTLTENSLTVAELYPNSSPETLLYANLASAPIKKNQLEPFDIALGKKLSPLEKKKVKNFTRLAEIPFNPSRRRNSVLVKTAGQLTLVVRGAPEIIMKLSANLSTTEKQKINQWISEQGVYGRRVLAVATKKINDQKSLNQIELLESALDWLGLISFVDPIKPGVAAAVKQAAKLKVKIKILTGDSREVAAAVAQQIGLVRSPDEVISGENLDRLSKTRQLQALEKYSVFARVSPEQKYNIIKLLQEKYFCGFLGEGINDTPALKLAGVSLVVQSAADITREVSDIVLLTKSLAVILDGINEGRKIFSNTTKYIKSTLASNFGNFYAIAIASMLIDFLPMLPVQILLVNLLSDFPLIALATDNIDKSELNQPQKYNIKDITIIATVLGVISTIFDFIFFGIFSRISPGVLQTNWFIGSILTELVFIFSIRTKRFFLWAKPPSFTLSALTVSAFAATIILPLTTFGQNVFHFIKPTAAQLMLILGIVAIYFVCTEIVKLAYYKIFNQPNNDEAAH